MEERKRREEIFKLTITVFQVIRRGSDTMVSLPRLITCGKEKLKEYYRIKHYWLPSVLFCYKVHYLQSSGKECSCKK